MIRKTLQNSKLSTFAIAGLVGQNNTNKPLGTGFFVSGEGHFITAAHVLYNTKTRTERFNLQDILLIRDIHDELKAGNSTCCSGALLEVDFENDVALLKVADEEIKDTAWLVNGKFPHLKISKRVLDEAEPVYAYGYPLSNSLIIETGKQVQINIKGQGLKSFPLQSIQTHLCPRITSMIVSSKTESSITSSCIPNTYVLDKALNYGNSGGPIIATETGYVHAVCRKFQPVQIPQNHIKDGKGNSTAIVIPSLYGVASNLSIESLIKIFEDYDIELVD